jgi:hypothetical protein
MKTYLAPWAGILASMTILEHFKKINSGVTTGSDKLLDIIASYEYMQAVDSGDASGWRDEIQVSTT